ncbi:DNA topoisomerase 3-alpha [Dispira simplex]|nr:DNA topoisomerase 3-alpha [Dispira simplex]
MVLRVTANNRPYIGCLGYPQCRSSIWFPNYVTQVKAENMACTRCDFPSQPVKLVTFEFPDGSLPFGYISPALTRIPSQPIPLSDMMTSLAPVGSLPTTPLSNAANMFRRTNSSSRTIGRATLSASSSFLHNPVVESINGGKVLCQCLQPAVLRVTKKEGPNKDRSFYSCSKPMDDWCSFFQWADQPIPSQDYSPSSDTLNAFRQHLESVNGDGADRRVQCYCGRLATQNVVLKEGENQGRPYFKCSKSYQPCKFFQWADEAVGNFDKSTMSFPIGLANGGSTQASSSASRATTSQPNPNMGSDWMASAQCYVCNEVGHIVSSCPQKSGTQGTKRSRASTAKTSASGSRSSRSSGMASAKVTKRRTTRKTVK